MNYQDRTSLKEHCQSLGIEKRVPRGFQAMRGKKRIQILPGVDPYEKSLKTGLQDLENPNMISQVNFKNILYNF